MIIKVGSPEWVRNLYHLNQGGINISQMRRTAIKGIINPKGAVDITISAEAKRLAAENDPTQTPTAYDLRS
jgi:hypothetical protein